MLHVAIQFDLAPVRRATKSRNHEIHHPQEESACGSPELVLRLQSYRLRGKYQHSLCRWATGLQSSQISCGDLPPVICKEGVRCREGAVDLKNTTTLVEVLNSWLRNLKK